MKKIVVIGPESTGKSTLCMQLAARYDTVWCPEYAREYLQQHGMAYTYDDLLKVARGQLELEDAIARDARNGLYFVDTDMYVMKIWCEVVFNNCHTWILKQVVHRKYDGYLLCRPDLPWTPDGLREYPDVRMRMKLYRMYRDHLIQSGLPWAEVYGSDADRLQRAAGLIDSMVSSER